MAARSFRKRLEEAVLERHCANHPMTEKWARGELSNRCLMGWAAEQWHWVNKMSTPTFYICKDAPGDVFDLVLRASRLDDLRGGSRAIDCFQSLDG